MANETLNSKITIAEPFGKSKIGNLTIEDAEFWGRPNFSGEENQFRETKRQFSVRIPNEIADQLRDLGWNVKTTLPTPEEIAEGREPRSGLKVAVDFRFNPSGGQESGPDIWLIAGESREKLTSTTVGALDRSRIVELAMEIRAWNYNEDEVEKGLEEPKYSARLVQLVAVIQPNILQNKYGVI